VNGTLVEGLKPERRHQSGELLATFPEAGQPRNVRRHPPLEKDRGAGPGQIEQTAQRRKRHGATAGHKESLVAGARQDDKSVGSLGRGHLAIGDEIKRVSSLPERACKFTHRLAVEPMAPVNG
jgi:hypothetical protein